jgi:hypothetical protein
MFEALLFFSCGGVHGTRGKQKGGYAGKSPGGGACYGGGPDRSPTRRQILPKASRRSACFGSFQILRP